MFPMNYLVFDTVPEALRYIDKVESSNQGRFVADPSEWGSQLVDSIQFGS